MEFLTIAIVLLITMLLLKTVYKINNNEIKKIGDNNKELDNITSKYPSNIDICKNILKKLNNEKVKIEEDKNFESSLYIAISNKIIIGDTKGSFTRIQTICHECLHSVQDKGIQLFNFIYSNLYIIYLIIISIFVISGKIQNKMMFLGLYIFLGYVYFFIRSYLENDAMIKARFLAKEYLEEQNLSTKEEIQKIVNEYDKLNFLGIKAINFKLFSSTIIKTIILSLIMMVR